MHKAAPLTPSALALIAPLYQQFAEVAQTAYGWHLPAPELEEVTRLLDAGSLMGVYVYHVAEQSPQGFMLYAVEPHGAVEINVLHIPGEDDWQTVFDVLMREFIVQIRDREDWETVSFAMLGRHQRFALTAPWYGFMPEGQAVQTFNLMTEISLPILQKQHTQLGPLDPDFDLRTWQPEDADKLPKLIYDCFHQQADAQWDPRFASVAGATQALTAITTGAMGIFKPEWQTVLLKGDTPIGFCFLLQTTEMEGNIALIGVHPTYKRQGLGAQVMRHALVNFVKGVANQQWMLSHITATMSTDSIPAIHLYRRFGFQETDCYPHCYLTRESAARSYYGKALFNPSTPAGCCH